MIKRHSKEQTRAAGRVLLPARVRLSPVLLITSVSLILVGCAGDPLEKLRKTTQTPQQPVLDPAIANAPAVRISFNARDYYSLANPYPPSRCAGDAKTYYDAYKREHGAPVAFPPSVVDSTVGTKPLFIRNISVDLTNANYEVAENKAYECSFGSRSGLPPPSRCAFFDETPGATSLPASGLGADGYSTGYYTLFDLNCAGAGPISGVDSSLSKLLAGGVYIDLDRKALGNAENLLLNVVSLPLGPDNERPTGMNPANSSGTRYTASESAIIKVHLLKTGLTEDALRGIPQPRFFTFTGAEVYPQVVQTLSVLAPPATGPRQDQVVIPLSSDPSIDQIRIERYSGSAILVEMSLYRMGERAGEVNP